jgi:DNA-binding winged helix-turn-helix (wHTH) protein/tetratricopeptide (TPR) repeat protein
VRRVLWHGSAVASSTLALTDCLVDLDRAEVRRGHERVSLTPLELGLLRYLAERPGEAISRQTLLVEVWGYRPGVRSRAVDHAVGRLRKKLERDDTQPDHLHTARGIGFRLELSAGPQPQLATPRAHLAPLGAPLHGREELLAWVQHQWAFGEPVVAITGVSGIGKSHVARHLAHAASQTRRVRLGCGTTVVRALADALGLPVHDLGAMRAALVRLDGALVVLDGPADPDELARWTTSAPHVHWLLAGPRPPPWAPRRALAPLEPLHAAAVFDHIARTLGGRTTQDDPDARALVQAVGGWPLALELTARRSVVLGAPEVLRRWHSARMEPLQRALEGSMELLGEPAKRTLGALALCAQAIPARDAALLGDPDVLTELHSAGWTRTRAEGAIEVPYATHLKGALEHAGATALFARWCAQRADLPPEDHARALRIAIDRRSESLISCLAPTLGTALLRSGEGAKAVALLQAAREHVPPPMASRLSLELSRVHSALGQPGMDDLERASAWIRVAGDDALKARMHVVAASLTRHDDSRVAEAETAIEAALMLADRSQDPDVGALAYGAAAELRMRLGQRAGAIDAARRGLVLSGHTPIARANLGLALIFGGRLHEAADELYRAMEQLEDTGDHDGSAVCELNLGVALRIVGARRAALGHLEAATQAVRAMGRTAWTVVGLGNLALLHPDGRLLSDEAVDLAEHMGRPAHIAGQLTIRAELCRRAGQVGPGRAAARRALDEAGEDARMAGLAHLALARLGTDDPRVHAAAAVALLAKRGAEDEWVLAHLVAAALLDGAPPHTAAASGVLLDLEPDAALWAARAALA